jgi:hypothetical protein
MSRTVWNILGILTILAGISMLPRMFEQFANLSPDRHFQYIVECALFLGVLVAIAVLCFFPKSHPVTLRIVGAIGISGCVFNLVEGFRQRNFAQYPIVLGFWLPGSIYLILKGKMN